MQNAANRVVAMRQLVDDGVATAVERLLTHASDPRLNRVNPLAFALEHDLDENETISAFLHATQHGLFELSWSVICASCGGVLHSVSSLRAIDQQHYSCAFCATDCEPNLDDTVEITFTVAPTVRRIAAHDPEALPLWAYARQIFWSSGSDLPDDLTDIVREAVLDAVELEAGLRVVRPLQMMEGLVVLFDPVTHRSQFLEVSGPTVATSQDLTISINDLRSRNVELHLSPGPVNLTIENNTSDRVLPILWIVGEALKKIIARRIPVLTAKRLLTHQTFRDLYRTGVLDIHQRFKITSLSFLFTDLKGSTALYAEIGDLAAFDLIRSHFQISQEIISRGGGAVVKTIGDAIMATFPKPAQSLAAAFEIRKAIGAFNRRDDRGDLLLKIGLHSGPCLAVVMNGCQDYFGQTVNIASRVQALSSTDMIFATSAIAEDAETRAFIARRGTLASSSKSSLRGIDQEMLIYEIPDCQLLSPAGSAVDVRGASADNMVIGEL